MLIKFTPKQLKKITSVAESVAVYPETIFSKPKNVSDFINAHRANLEITEKEKEYFYVFGLSTKNKIKFMDVVSVGTLNFSVVHPREVFRPAVLVGCASIIIAHNHPSGSIEPSEEDIRLTKRLTEGGKLLGIEVLDHVITGEAGKYYSFKESGLMNRAVPVEAGE